MEAQKYLKNLSKAQNLLSEVREAGLSYGCLEVSLVALGAELSLKNIDRSQKEASLITEVLNKSGFEINWIINSQAAVTSDEIFALLTDQVILDEDFPHLETAGFLILDHYPDRNGHALAILPHETSPFLVMDTSCFGTMDLEAYNIAHVLNYTLSHGGSYEILELKHKKVFNLYSPE